MYLKGFLQPARWLIEGSSYQSSRAVRRSVSAAPDVASVFADLVEGPCVKVADGVKSGVTTLDPQNGAGTLPPSRSDERAEYDETLLALGLR